MPLLRGRRLWVSLGLRGQGAEWRRVRSRPGVLLMRARAPVSQSPLLSGEHVLSMHGGVCWYVGFTYSRDRVSRSTVRGSRYTATIRAP